MSEKMVLSPKQGYNLIAPFYDSWKWQEFWRLNEQPFIKEWCRYQNKGYGADLGTGSGNNLKCFLDAGHNVVAYDISDMMLMVCKEKYKSEIETKRLKCVVMDINELYLQQKPFDWILCNRVFSHIYDVSNVIRRAARLLRDDGEFFISDIHPKHSYEHTHFKISGIDFFIETYKHGLKELEGLFFRNKMKIVDFREFSKVDLLDCSIIANNFHSIKDETTPIFFYYILKKMH